MNIQLLRSAALFHEQKYKTSAKNRAADRKPKQVEPVFYQINTSSTRKSRCFHIIMITTSSAFNFFKNMNIQFLHQDMFVYFMGKILLNLLDLHIFGGSLFFQFWNF
jgi:hypothetical protein